MGKLLNVYLYRGLLVVTLPDTLVQVKVGKDVKETIERIQKQLLKIRGADGRIKDPDGWVLFHRDPSLGDIIRQAVAEWREKHKL